MARKFPGFFFKMEEDAKSVVEPCQRRQRQRKWQRMQIQLLDLVSRASEDFQNTCKNLCVGCIKVQGGVEAEEEKKCYFSSL